MQQEYAYLHQGNLFTNLNFVIIIQKEDLPLLKFLVRK